MNKNTLTWIALRYFRSKKKTGLISFTSYVSIFGIAIGAFALVVTLSVLNGFEEEISSRVIDVESHLRITGPEVNKTTITSAEKILQSENVRSIHPFISKKSVLSSDGNDAVVRIKSIDSLALEQNLSVEDVLIRGSRSYRSAVSEMPGILVGFRLADKLGLYIGDTVNVVNPLNIGSRFAIPFVGQFVLTGVFRLDLFDYDDNLAFIDLSQGQRIFDMKDRYSGIDIKFDEYDQIQAIKALLTSNLHPDLIVSSWEDLHKTLFGAMKLEKYGSFLALCFIILVAIFNLTSSLIMLVLEKIREIGMMQALGMNAGHIQGIFLRLGLITGGIGLAIGIVVALTICLLQQYYQLIPLPPVYFIRYLPVVVNATDVILITLAGVLLVLLGTIYPSWRVGKLLPLEAIQYEK